MTRLSGRGGLVAWLAQLPQADHIAFASTGTLVKIVEVGVLSCQTVTVAALTFRGTHP